MALSLASQFLACRLCWNARPPCRNCCEKCTDQCNNRPKCYQNLTEKTLVQLAHINNKPEGNMSMQIDPEKLKWLVSCPSGDANFKSQLASANEITIRQALEEVDDGEVTKKKALERGLKKLLEATAGALSETNNHHNGILKMDVATYEAEKEDERQRSAEQTAREKMIARYHEAVGQIKTANMFAEFSQVSALIWIQQMRDTKLYKEFGTWDKFCESIGYTRQHIEDQLKNLTAFGEKFTQTVCALGVGYRDLRKLRQLTHDGSVIIDGDCLVIDTESIPIDQDHAEELQAAIERIITANNETKKRVDKLEKDLRGAVKEETSALNSELRTQTLRVRELEKYEPHAHDETWCEEQMAGIAKDTAILRTSIGNFVIDPRLDGDRPAQAGVLAFITQAQNLLYDLRTHFENAFSTGE